MELKDSIKVYETSLNPEIIGSFIKYCNKIDFKAGKVVGKEGKETVDKSTRNTNTWFFKANTMSDIHWKNFWNTVIISNLYNTYRQTIKFTNGHIGCDGLIDLQCLKYEEGGFYRAHSDNLCAIPRTLSIIYFLNDDYEGGELNFHCPITGEIYKTVKPKPGRAIVWPSNFLYPHSVTPVSKSKRYTLVSWIR